MNQSQEQLCQPSATRLSQCVPDSGTKLLRFGLACRSLVLLSSMLAATGCIVADPPEYRAPVRTRPLVESYKAVPPINDIVVWSTSKPPIIFSIPIRSEDAGVQMFAHSFLDYGTSEEQQLRIVNIAPSTYDESRTVEVQGPPATSKDGCHVFTVVVAHDGSFLANDGFHLDPSKAGDDAGIVSWFMNINAPDNAVNTLRDCPRSGLPKLP